MLACYQCLISRTQNDKCHFVDTKWQLPKLRTWSSWLGQGRSEGRCDKVGGSRRPCSVTVCLWCVCVRECSSQGRGREGGRGRVIEKNKPARKGRETDGAPLVWITSQPLYLRYISNSNEKVYFKSSLVLSTSLVRILWSFTSHFIATRRVKPLHTDIRKWNICRFKHKA